MDKKPGMTLDGIGLFYQRDQTWFKQSKAWIEYLTRCQALLQLGKPVVDIGVFTGEEIPSRSVLPDRLINTLPGLFGKEKVEAERKRLLNEGQPQRTIPDGVTHSANMADPENYVGVLNGYKYDCFNPDVLMQMTVKNGRVATPGGVSYGVLVIPAKHPMNPNAVMSDKVKNKLKQLAAAGAKIISGEEYFKNLGSSKNIYKAPYWESSLEKLGAKEDLIIENNANKIAWIHRKLNDLDIYFLTNQTNGKVSTVIKLPFSGKEILMWKPVVEYDWKYPENIYSEKDYTIATFNFEPYESFIVAIRKSDDEWAERWPINVTSVITNPWQVHFFNGVDTIKKISQSKLYSWSLSSDTVIKYFSGTAVYTNTFVAEEEWVGRGIKLIFDSIYNIASVKINGIECGTAWTKPYEVRISDAVKPGENKVEIEVTNTWRNKLIYDELHPEKRTTWFNSPYKLKDKPLLPAGIVGEVKIFVR
jgi:hypothetical protein